jgi:hypothetical protein
MLAGVMPDAGERLIWFLDRLRDGCAGVSDADVAAAWTSTPPAPPVEVRRAVCAHFAASLGTFTVRGYEPVSDDFAAASLTDQRGRVWRVWVQLEPTSDRRIRVAAPVLAPPPGISLRVARPDDASALRALERRCPIVMGDVRATYDRGEDFFAGARLIGDAYPTVAERDGALVAMHCMVTHDLRIAGSPVRATYLHHSRILPEVQGGGVFSALNGAELERHARESGLFYSYVALGNEAALKVVPVKPWALRPERLVIDCRRQAGPTCGRPATPRDAERVVELVNAAHGREELFVPYTVDRLTARLGREPVTYGWAHLRLDARAVIGVWPAPCASCETHPPAARRRSAPWCSTRDSNPAPRPSSWRSSVPGAVRSQPATSPTSRSSRRREAPATTRSTRSPRARKRII